MWLIELLAEQKIREAVDQGKLDKLPGAGKPLLLDDDRMVPEELRAGYRLLKNAGYLPPEVESLKQARELRALVKGATDTRKRDQYAQRLRLLELRLNRIRGPGLRRIPAAASRQATSRLRRE